MLQKELLPKIVNGWNGLKIHIPYADPTMFPIQIRVWSSMPTDLPATIIEPQIAECGESRIVSQELLEKYAPDTQITIQVSNGLVSISSKLNQEALHAGMRIASNNGLKLNPNGPWPGKNIRNCLWTVYIDIGG